MKITIFKTVIMFVYLLFFLCGKMIGAVAGARLYQEQHKNQPGPQTLILACTGSAYLYRAGKLQGTVSVK
jgi:uncharacterized membrane protein